MPIRHKGTALLGVVLGISFLAMQTFAFTPVFGGRTGLEFSDDLFNSLAKGSSYFVPQLSSRVKRVEGQEVAASVRMGSADQAARALKVFSQAAPDTTAQGAVLSVKGDLGKLLGAALGDSRAMYSNNAGDLRARYGADGGAVMVTWDSALNGLAGELLKGDPRSVAQSKLIATVVAQGIEPAYNFYGIQPESVSHRSGTLTALLTYYVVYTVWWGFAIYFLFDGFGLAMTKARVRREI